MHGNKLVFLYIESDSIASVLKKTLSVFVHHDNLIVRCSQEYLPRHYNFQFWYPTYCFCNSGFLSFSFIDLFWSRYTAEETSNRNSPKDDYRWCVLIRRIVLPEVLIRIFHSVHGGVEFDFYNQRCNQWSNETLNNLKEKLFISKQRLGIDFSVPTNEYATIEKVFETMFSVRSMLRPEVEQWATDGVGHQDTDWPSLTTWIWLWRISFWGYNCATLFLGHINMGTWPFRLRESQIWESKLWSCVLRNSDPKRTVLARPRNSCKIQTHSFVREVAQ
jgi:hypothetical protein